MGKPFRTTRRVEFHQTDAAGIMHFAQFYVWMEQAEHEMLRSVGLSVLDATDGEVLSWPRVASSCEFVNPVRFEDVVDVAVSVARMGNSSVTYRTEFTLEGRPVARGEMTAVCCQVRDHSLTAVAIPARFRERLSQFGADG